MSFVIKKIAHLIVLGLCFCAITYKANAEQSDASLMASGQWRDSDTGVIWMRCSLGQVWRDETCAGMPVKYTWPDAVAAVRKLNFAGKNNWILPAIQDLASLINCDRGFSERAAIPTKINNNTIIIDEKCNSGSNVPTINLSIFPNTEGGGYFTSSLATDSLVWYVDFQRGYSNKNSQDYSYYIRPVRLPIPENLESGQPIVKAVTKNETIYSPVVAYSTVNADAKKNLEHKRLQNQDQKLMSQGLWRDATTSNIWMRCSLGQVWNGDDCVGEAKKYTWQEAMLELDKLSYAGVGDWILPSIADLATLMRCAEGFKKKDKIPANNGEEVMIDDTCNDNSQDIKINQVVFPNTQSVYWSASAQAGSSSRSWFVSFEKGYVYNADKNGKAYVRAVRASSFAHIFAEQVSKIKEIEQEKIKRQRDAELEQKRYEQELRLAQAKREQEAQAELARYQQAARRAELLRQQEIAKEQARREKIAKAAQKVFLAELDLSATDMYYKAESYFRQGQYKHARWLLQRLLVQYPSDPITTKAQLLLGRL